MTVLENQRFDAERALYNTGNTLLRGCTFAGPADGESALKESADFAVENCCFALRYPLWHTARFTVTDSRFTDTCRAAAWYAAEADFTRCNLAGIKALRECRDIRFTDCEIHSAEFGWRCDTVHFQDCFVRAEYFMLQSRNVTAKNLTFSGKYSFQYAENLALKNCTLNTKDAFWHCRNAVVENCILQGEYLAWYSENLTLRNCRISGTQPFCYCKGLVLENCILTDCDLCFEYSDVTADLNGRVVSVKNPKSGRIVADGYDEIISENAVYDCHCAIECR